MQCDICRCPASSRLPVNCTLCARNALYHPRVQLAQALLRREQMGNEVGQTAESAARLNPAPLSKASKPLEPQSDTQPGITWTIGRAAAERVLSIETKETTLRHVQILRDEIRNTRNEIAERKARLQRRRSEFASAKQELSQGQASGIEPVAKGIQRTSHRRSRMHEKTAESRLYLCREAALLYGLQQRKRKKGGLGRDVYFIGGVPIIDLRDLNSV